MVQAMKSHSYGAALIATIACSVSLLSEASAATVTIESQNITDYTTSSLPTSTFNPLWDTALSHHVALRTGSVVDKWRSPFENFSTPGTGVGDWSTLQYTSVQAHGRAVFNVFGVGATELSLLWGSPDSYNKITFYSGLNGTGTKDSITGSQLLIQTYGHDLVTLDPGFVFLSVVLSSKQNAFEFADLQTIGPGGGIGGTTPLPGALVLFGTGLAGAGFLMRRRRDGARTAC
jgi:hypothetical protein